MRVAERNPPASVSLHNSHCCVRLCLHLFSFLFEAQPNIQFLKFILLAVVLVSSCAVTVNAKLKYSGMTFTNERYCPNVTIASTRAVQSLQHLATTGANYVALVVTWYQDDVTSTEIYPVFGDPVRCTATPHGYCSTATDDEVLAAITTIHSLGMKVLLKPQIDFLKAANPNSWRGDIGEGMTAVQWEQWFNSYTAMIVHYAAIAELRGVGVFSVSCELVTASRQEVYWRDMVISAVRNAFTRGQITSSANWGDEANNKAWWDAVDFIGIDEYEIKTYWSLINGSYPTLSQLLEKWAPVEAQIELLHKKFNKSVVFTEIGYCSGVGANCFANTDAPLPNPPTTEESLNSQSTQYLAALTAMSKYPWFEGVFWWNWATDAAFGGVGNTCMDPKFKPSENLLRNWYEAMHPQPQPPSTTPTCKCWL